MAAVGMSGTSRPALQPTVPGRQLQGPPFGKLHTAQPPGVCEVLLLRGPGEQRGLARPGWSPPFFWFNSHMSLLCGVWVAPLGFLHMKEFRDLGELEEPEPTAPFVG